MTRSAACIHLQIVRLVISQFGWREAFVVMGVLSLVMCGVAAWFAGA
jgi:hypothetical protein